MRFNFITLFPDKIESYFSTGIPGKARTNQVIDIRTVHLREFAGNKHNKVDDTIYGGGPGMVMMAEPLALALAAARQARSGLAGPVIHFTPTGQPITQAWVREFATSPGAVLLCGRYEGIDQRLLDRHVDLELSLGDFVLSGGELPALALIDAVARLQDGVLGDAQSHLQDSFSDGLLDCPHYSRPEVWAGDGQELPVPEVLLSGNHAAIARWRRERSLEISARRRPDLIAAARDAGRLSAQDIAFLATLGL